MRPPSQWMEYTLHATSKVRRDAVSPYGTIQGQGDDPFVDVELQRFAPDGGFDPSRPLADQIYGDGRINDWILVCCGYDRERRQCNGLAASVAVLALLLFLIVFTFGLIGAVGHTWRPWSRPLAPPPY